LLVESGIPLHTVVKLLGHSSIRTTERYSHPEDSLRDAVEKIVNTDLKQKKTHNQRGLAPIVGFVSNIIYLDIFWNKIPVFINRF